MPKDPKEMAKEKAAKEKAAKEAKMAKEKAAKEKAAKEKAKAKGKQQWSPFGGSIHFQPHLEYPQSKHSAQPSL